MEIKDKVVIVTGASDGIGKATAVYLAGQGAKVALAARGSEKLKELERTLPGSYAMTVDMTKPEDVFNMVGDTLKKFGRVDILINNAGRGMYAPVANADIGKMKEIAELNLFAPIRAMQAVIPIMRKQGGGMIINVSSGTSRMTIPSLAPYASLKYALNNISLTARKELEEDHIVVSIILPRITATDFGRNAVGGRPDWVTRPREGRPTPMIDPPETVAEKIGELIRSEEAEIVL